MLYLSCHAIADDDITMAGEVQPDTSNPSNDFVRPSLVRLHYVGEIRDRLEILLDHAQDPPEPHVFYNVDMRFCIGSKLTCILPSCRPNLSFDELVV